MRQNVYHGFTKAYVKHFSMKATSSSVEPISMKDNVYYNSKVRILSLLGATYI